MKEKNYKHKSADLCDLKLVVLIPFALPNNHPTLCITLYEPLQWASEQNDDKK